MKNCTILQVYLFLIFIRFRYIVILMSDLSLLSCLGNFMFIYLFIYYSLVMYY